MSVSQLLAGPSERTDENDVARMAEQAGRLIAAENHTSSSVAVRVSDIVELNRAEDPDPRGTE